MCFDAACGGGGVVCFCVFFYVIATLIYFGILEEVAVLKSRHFSCRWIISLGKPGNESCDLQLQRRRSFFSPCLSATTGQVT